MLVLTRLDLQQSNWRYPRLVKIYIFPFFATLLFAYIHTLYAWNRLNQTHPFLKRIYFKFKVKVVDGVKCHGHEVRSTHYRFISLSSQVNRTTDSCINFISKFDFENPRPMSSMGRRSRSYSRNINVYTKQPKWQRRNVSATFRITILWKQVYVTCPCVTNVFDSHIFTYNGHGYIGNYCIC